MERHLGRHQGSRRIHLLLRSFLSVIFSRTRIRNRFAFRGSWAHLSRGLLGELVLMSCSSLVRNTNIALILLSSISSWDNCRFWFYWLRAFFRELLLHDCCFLILHFLEHLHLLVISKKHIIIILNFIVLVEHVVVEVLFIFFLAVEWWFTMPLKESSKFFLNLFWRWWLILASSLSTLTRFLLQPFSISERIESVISGAHSWANASKHNNLTLIISHERVS